ncbi:MAG: IPTL-CTERM sorting domain-containing protein [Casimicrobiaceae bacterium]
MRFSIVLISMFAAAEAFAGQTVVAPIGLPTLGETGLMALAAMVGVAAALFIRRKK